MSIFLIIAIAMAITLVLLRKHFPIGIAIMVAGIFIWLMTGPQINELTQA
ncbi:MAG TPA: hypothetical protein IAC65_04185, partial [Candidatus Aphodousia faecipullorum]|nr:hypothetical protein [Candidatus Aphodousia faecipullorum]